MLLKPIEDGDAFEHIAAGAVDVDLHVPGADAAELLVHALGGESVLDR